MHFAWLWAGCLGSILGFDDPPAPVRWSPDGRWLAYSQEVRPTRSPPTGWLLGEGGTDPERPIADPPTSFRLWATCPETRDSVLVFESRSPVSAPRWRPLGTSLAYGRVATSPGEPPLWEVVVQDAPAQARVVSRRPIAGPEPSAEAVRGLSPTFSPDGTLLAVPQPSPPGLLIIRADNGKVLRTIEGGLRPEWSPEGGKLAFYRDGLDAGLFVLENLQANPRRVASLPAGDAGRLPAPAWTRDGQCLLFLRLTSAGGDDRGKLALQLVKVRAAAGVVEAAHDLVLEPIPDRRSWSGAWFGIDPERKDFFCATASAGQRTTQIAWSDDFEKPLEVHKRFNPYDETSPVGAIAVRPSGRGIALRSGIDGGWSPPAVWDSENGRTTLIAPDADAHAEWQGRIAWTIRDSLRGRLPVPSLGAAKRAVDRPSLLPAPGELEENDPDLLRLRRLARLGRSLGPVASADHRAAFAYLAGDYPTALAVVDEMRGSCADPARAARLLGLRAQVSLASRDFEGSRRATAFLRGKVRPTFAVDDAPDGTKALTPIVDPRDAWPDFLDQQAGRLKIEPPAVPADPSLEEMDPLITLRRGANLFQKAPPVFPAPPGVLKRVGN